MTAGDAGHTIGVTVAIPSPYRETIDDVRARHSLEPLDMPAHITILAPVDVDAAALPGVLAHLQRVAERTSAFSVLLRGTGTFRPVSPVVFLALAQGISACEQLESDVRSGVLGVELRFPYHPHVTLAHDVDEHRLDEAFASLADYTVGMQISGMDLHEFDGSEWRLLHAFPFTG